MTKTPNFKVVEVRHEATIGNYNYMITVLEKKVWIKRKPTDMSWHTLPCVSFWNGTRFACVLGADTAMEDVGTFENAVDICMSQAD